jgi:hypothetical protein
LCLANPSAVRRIQVAGPNLAKVEAFATAVEPDFGCDVSLIHDLGSAKGAGASWDISLAPWAKTFNTLRLVAEFDGPDHTVTVELSP